MQRFGYSSNSGPVLGLILRRFRCPMQQSCGLYLGLAMSILYSHQLPNNTCLPFEAMRS